MPSKLGSFIASFALAALTLGLATPALADVPPTKPKPDTKQDKGADEPAKDEKVAEKTSGKCSVSDAPEQGFAGFALAVLLLSAVGLGRQRSRA